MLDMKRREFITLLGGAAAWPLVALKAERRVGPHDGLMGRNLCTEIRPAFTFNERRGGATLSRSQVETAHQGHSPA